MRVLAFDTSTEWCSVAMVVDGQGRQYEEMVGHRHSDRLLPMIDAALADADCSLRDIDGIGFGAGPGSFTGIRIGCGVAQGLSFGTGLPVVPVSSLAAIAHEAWRVHAWGRVIACADARMREVYLAAYRRGGNGWDEVRPPAVMPPSGAAATRMADDGEWHGAGGGFAAYPALAALLGLGAVAADLRPTARAVGELAAPRLAAGEGVGAADALPLYVRHRVALTTAERDAGLRL